MRAEPGHDRSWQRDPARPARRWTVSSSPVALAESARSGCSIREKELSYERVSGTKGRVPPIPTYTMRIKTSRRGVLQNKSTYASVPRSNSMTSHCYSRELKALKYVTRLYASAAKSFSRPTTFYCIAHGHRFFSSAGDGADGSILRLQRHDHNRDRSYIHRSLDRFERSEILRGPLASQHRYERPSAGG